MRLLVAIALALVFPATAAALPGDPGAALKLRLTVPKRAFSGYPILASVRAGGVPDGESVTVQRRAGRRWKQAATATILRERADGGLHAAEGAARVRLKAVVGTQTGTSPARKLTVARAQGWTTTHDVGRYTGKAEGADAELKVAGGRPPDPRLRHGGVDVLRRPHDPRQPHHDRRGAGEEGAGSHRTAGSTRARSTAAAR